MARIEYPDRLSDRLQGSPLDAPLRLYADRVGEVLADNKLPFFPNYTDHGVYHVNRLLETAVELVPSEIWGLQDSSGKAVFRDADACILVGAALLHDLAMHLRPAGFLELVEPGSRWRPMGWFADAKGGHSGDLPWPELWREFVREARRSSDEALARIVGEEAVRRGWTFTELPQDPGDWQRNHRLVIGEFLRRHHPRLAHEIALHGFPGLEPGTQAGAFPALSDLGDEIGRLGDLIGLVARSHGVSLRLCQAYLESEPLYQRGGPRKLGSAVYYPMALLRVADYLQLQSGRAPTALLQLRQPQSPISVDEWRKHGAVLDIGQANDPRGISVTVAPDLPLSLLLQLEKLLGGLQEELDHSTAVLDEIYGLRGDLGLDHLQLRYRRVVSNLFDPGFRKALPYIAEEISVGTDPSLLRLLVGPLYGDDPQIGVRELTQNAVDAVRELHQWCESREIDPYSLDLVEQEADVLIELVEGDSGPRLLRVTDKGIGMTAHTVIHYFLRAGASFRDSPQWSREFVSADGQPSVARAGRFGIGFFAVYLLGEQVRVRTRHVSESDGGLSLEVSPTGGSLLLEKVPDLPVGTVVEVELSREASGALKERVAQWFRWAWPEVQVQRRSPSSKVEEDSNPPLDIHQLDASAIWSRLEPEGFEVVHWSVHGPSEITCNGFPVPRAERMLGGLKYTDFGGLSGRLALGRRTIELPRGLRTPDMAILDPHAQLPLTLDRSSLSAPLPFQGELAADMLRSLIAHALVCGPWQAGFLAAENRQGTRHPLVESRGTARWRWCSTESTFTFADPGLWGVLGDRPLLIWGWIRDHDEYGGAEQRSQNVQHPPACCLHADLDLSEPEISPADLGWGEFDEDQNYWQRLGELVEKELWRDSWPLQATSDVRLLILSHRPEEEMDLDLELEVQSLPRVPTGWRSGVEVIRGSDSVDLDLDALVRDLPPELGKENRTVYLLACQPPAAGRTSQNRLSHLWRKIIGPRGIPFEPDARRQMVEEVRAAHPEMRGHLDKWDALRERVPDWVG